VIIAAVLLRPRRDVGFIFALLAFAAGFLVRPFGALVFGRLGDLVGRKYTFLVTILIMGASTFSSACCRPTRRSGSPRRSS
jgi:MFS family permease